MRRAIAALILLVFPFAAIGQIKTTLPIGQFNAFDEGMEQALKRNAAARSAVLQQLIEMGEQAANQGVAYEFQQWKGLATDLAGGIFSKALIYDDTLRMTLRVQNAQAERTQARMNIKSQSNSTGGLGSSENDSKSYWRFLLAGEARNRGQVKLFVDPSSRQRQDSIATIWSLDSYDEAMENQGRKYLSTVLYSESDCSKNTIRFMEIAVYSNQMGNGNVIYSSDKPEPWGVASSSPRKSAIFKAACWGA